MYKEPKTSRIVLTVLLPIVAIVLFISWCVASHPDQSATSVTNSGESAIAKWLNGPLLSDGTKPASVADVRVKEVFAANFQRTDDIGPMEAFDDAMLSSSFQASEPINPQTGEAQHGYHARSIYDAFAYIDQSMTDPQQIWKRATELHMYWQDGALHGNFGGEFHAFRFDPYVYGQIAPTLTMNIVFDLPSGGHKYMKAFGYESTDDGVVIDDTCMPEMLAGIMTSQYMHIFVPVAGESSSTAELVYWTDSFKDLLSPNDRKQAQDSQAALDHDTPVTYDKQEENHASPQAPGAGPS